MGQLQLTFEETALRLAAAVLGRKGGRRRSQNLTHEQIQAIGRKGGFTKAANRRARAVFEAWAS